MRCEPQRSKRNAFGPRAAILGAILVPSAAMVGCTASGVADFVKLSPDSQRIVYQDTLYPRVYVYYTQSRQKKNQPFQDRYYRLSIGHSEWTESPPPHPQKLWAFRAAGLSEGGHVFWYASRGFSPPTTQPAGSRPPASSPTDTTLEQWPARWRAERRQEDGLDLEDGHPYAMYLLPSPDGKFVVRIADRDDPWHRQTIVELASGRKDILLDKDDAILVIPRTLYMFFIFDPLVLIHGGI